VYGDAVVFEAELDDIIPEKGEETAEEIETVKEVSESKNNKKNKRKPENKKQPNGRDKKKASPPSPKRETLVSHIALLLESNTNTHIRLSN